MSKSDRIDRWLTFHSVTTTPCTHSEAVEAIQTFIGEEGLTVKAGWIAVQGSPSKGKYKYNAMLEGMQVGE